MSKTALINNTRQPHDRSSRHWLYWKQFSHLVQKKEWLLLLLFIAAVSYYDTFLVTLYKDSILYDERNPICEALIRKDPDGLQWFIAGKILGNLCVAATLWLLFLFQYKQAFLVARCVALFQLGLLLFLTTSDSRTGILYFDGLFSYDPSLYWQGVFSLVVHGVVAVAAVATLVTFSQLRKRRPSTEINWG